MTVLIVGCGVIGLRTAVELVRNKTRIRLLSPRHPLHPSTCSVGAGGLWMPFHCDDERTNEWAYETLNELTHHADSSALDPKNSDAIKSLVEVVPAISFKQKPTIEPPTWATDPRSRALKFQTLTTDDLYKQSIDNDFRLPKREVIDEAGYKHSWLFYPPIVDSPRMLMHLVEELQSSEYTEDINFDGVKFASIQEMINEAKKHGCDSLVNCTGLGSKTVCGDESLIGARGILIQFDRASCYWDVQPESKDSVIMIEEPPFGSATQPCYMIPRGNIIAVGGTYLEGDSEKEIRAEEMTKMMQNASRMGINTDESMSPNQWVGFRPYRSSARLESDDQWSRQGVKVVHSFGYGGSGWTVYVGVAKAAASLVSSS